MDDKKYPIGTKVIYNPPYNLYITDEGYRNKVGIITANPHVFPLCEFPDGRSIVTAWRSLTPVKIKGQQLLFSFMSK